MGLVVVKKHTGFTLIELMITIAIFSILAAIAVPGYQNLISSNRLTASINNLHSGLSTARSEAIKRNTSITLAKTGSTWNSGWSVYETSNSGTKILDQKAIPSGISVDSSSSSEIVEFNPEGRSRVNNWGNSGVTFCREDKVGKKIDVAPSGSIRITEARCS